MFTFDHFKERCKAAEVAVDVTYDEFENMVLWCRRFRDYSMENKGTWMRFLEAYHKGTFSPEFRFAGLKVNITELPKGLQK